MEKKLTGLQKQDAFLTKEYSQPIKCPSCNGFHSLIEARGSSDWSKECSIHCPASKEPMIHNVALFGGGQSFSIIPSPERVITEEEEKEWQAFDDNLDWMDEETAKTTANKIRAKYNK